MRRRSWIRNLASWQSLCWITGAFLVSRLIILPQATAQLQVAGGCAVTLDFGLLLHPVAALETIQQLPSEARKLMTVIQLSAGLLDTVLITLVASGWLFFIHLRMRPWRRTRRASFVLPLILLASRLGAGAGIIVLMYTEGMAQLFILRLTQYSLAISVLITVLIIGIMLVAMTSTLLSPRRRVPINIR